MTVETMSIAKGLNELKLLNKRISNAMLGAKLVAVRIGEKPVVGFKDDEEFNVQANAKIDSIIDLIKRRDAIKGAVVVANATTTVKVGDETLTIASAIERKDSIQYLKDLLALLKNQYVSALNEFVRKDDSFKANLDKHLETLYGKEGKAKGLENRDALKPFLDMNEPHLVDPLNLKEVIDKLQEQIDVFEADVDLALSEVNHKTDITVEY